MTHVLPGAAATAVTVRPVPRGTYGSASPICAVPVSAPGGAGPTLLHLPPCAAAAAAARTHLAGRHG